jgi:hypothetical protein
MDKNQTKVLKVFLFAIHSNLYSFALRFIFLQTHATSYSFYSALVYTVKQKGGKPHRKPHPLPYDLRNPYRNLKCENSQDYAQKPQRNCKFMTSASGLVPCSATWLYQQLARLFDTKVSRKKYTGLASSLLKVGKFDVLYVFFLSTKPIFWDHRGGHYCFSQIVLCFSKRERILNKKGTVSGKL